MDREFCLDAYGQEWRIRFFPGSAVIPRRSAIDAWRAEVGDVFVEVPYIEGEAQADLESRLLAAIGGKAYRGVA
jgi:hypothetical protein